MSNVEQFIQIDFKQLFIWLILILLVVKLVVDAFSGTIGKWLKSKGIETASMREKRKDHEMILANAKAIKELAEIHKRDNDISNEHDDKLREDLSLFMTEVRSDIGELKNSMQESQEDSLKYRQISIDKEAILNNKINNLVEAGKQKDEIIETINEGLNRLTSMFVDKQVDDMRYKILNFASSISSGKKYNREAYDHILTVYKKYEMILEENNLKNGLVEESVQYIRSSYQECLKSGTFSY